METGWTIGRKLSFAFIGLAAITFVVGVLGFYGAQKNMQAIHEIGVVRLPSVENLLIVKAEGERIRAVMNALSIPGLPSDERNGLYKEIAEARRQYEEAWKIYEPLPQSPEEAEAWKRFVPAWNDWRMENNRLMELQKRLDALGLTHPVETARRIEQFSKDHYVLLHRIQALLEDKAAAFEGGDDHTACNAGRFFGTFATTNAQLTAAVKALAGPHQQFHEAVKRIKSLVAEGKQPEAREVLQRDMAAAMQAVFKHFGEMQAVADEAANVALEAEKLSLGAVLQKQNAALDLLDKLVEINQKLAEAETEEGQKLSAEIKMLVAASSLAALILSIVLGVLVTRSVAGPLRRVIAGLSEGSQEVAAAAGQVSSASQSLSEGATQQAASLEETSSSLEEMASMTKQNANNAQQANGLMNEAKQVVGAANSSMGQLIGSMGEISKASEETSKIVKTIDEIAFQTNLLALNAAVEAARAGEAGAGFAVVADEVRNLAMRAADAAKTTANLIEDTVKKVKEGGELVAQTNTAFGAVAGSAAKVSDLVAEIAAASNEQAQGISQINTAVTELDKVTQNNAASAEESASAAEEMSAQAETMKGMVAELSAMVGGGSRKGAAAAGREKPAADRRPAKRITQAVRKLSEKAGAKKKSEPTEAEKMIPLEEGFADF